MDARFHHRRSALLNVLGSRVATLLVTRPANWFYLTGFTGESGALIVSKKGTTLVTDGRFMVQAKAEARGIRIRQQEGTLLESVARVLRDLRARRVGFDPAHMAVSELQGARKASGRRLEWVPAAGTVETLRMRKDAGELAQMRKAAILAGRLWTLRLTC